MTAPALVYVPTFPWIAEVADHSPSCDCDPPSSRSLMFWASGDPIYRPSDYDTPPYTPGSTR